MHPARTNTNQKRTRTTKHTFQRSVYSRNTFSPRPQSVHASDITGPHRIARNHAPQSRQRHTAAHGRQPTEQPPRVLLTIVSSTLPWMAPAPKSSIEGSLSRTRMSSRTRDPTARDRFATDSRRVRTSSQGFAPDITQFRDAMRVVVTSRHPCGGSGGVGAVVVRAALVRRRQVGGAEDELGEAGEVEGGGLSAGAV